MRKILAILCFVLLGKSAHAQEWSGWRANIEPGATWVFGSGDYIGDVWRFSESFSTTTGVYNYGTNYKPLYTRNAAGLSWRFEVLRRGERSNRTLGLRISFLRSSGNVYGEASTPARSTYIESCRIFGQTLLPLINDDEPGGVSRVLCGGETRVNTLDLGVFAENAIFENQSKGLYLNLGLNFRNITHRRHDWSRQIAVLRGYFGNGQDFVNFVSLDAWSRSRSWSLGPTFGIRGSYTNASRRLSFETRIEQYVGIGKLGIESPIWVDDDDIHMRTTQGLGQTVLYLNGEFPMNSISTWSAIFGTTLELRTMYQLNKDFSVGATASCRSLGSIFKPARWNVPADWSILQGTGWVAGDRQSLNACGLSSRITLTL